MLHLHWYEYLILAMLLSNAFVLGQMVEEGLSFHNRKERTVSFLAIIIAITIGGIWMLATSAIEWVKKFCFWFMAITQIAFWWQWHFTNTWETITDEQMDTIALRITLIMKAEKRTLIQRHHLHCCQMIRNKHIVKFKQRANEI